MAFCRRIPRVSPRVDRASVLGFVMNAEAAGADKRELESERRETLKSHVLLEARRARLTSELQVCYVNRIACRATSGVLAGGQEIIKRFGRCVWHEWY